jgi:hypothetical protein
MKKNEREALDELRLITPSELTPDEILRTCQTIEDLLGPAGPVELCYDLIVRCGLQAKHTSLVEEYYRKVLN